MGENEYKLYTEWVDDNGDFDTGTNLLKPLNEDILYNKNDGLRTLSKFNFNFFTSKLDKFLLKLSIELSLRDTNVNQNLEVLARKFNRRVRLKTLHTVELGKLGVGVPSKF